MPVTADVFCTTKVPLGSPYLTRLALSADWSVMLVCCPLGMRTRVFTLKEVARSFLEASLNILVEISSTPRTLTNSLGTPAVIATLRMYLPSPARKSALDIGNVTTMTIISKGEQDVELLAP